MKRIIAVFICLLAVVNISAKTSKNTSEHLKFMGIPITGTINQFQQKLIAKGCKVSKLNKFVSTGCRAFDGNFIGNKANIYIYYDTKTKIVYRAKAVLSNLSDEIADQKYNELKYKLMQKYGDGITGELEGKESKRFISYNYRTDSQMGSIDLFISYDTPYLSYLSDQNLHIDYHDYQNNQKHEQSDIDEL